MSASEAVPTQAEQKPFLLVLTGPVLNFLAAQEQKRAIQGEVVEEKKIVFWPFAVAGISLFGLGVAGGHAFMSGSVKEQAPGGGEAKPAEAQPKGRVRVRHGAKPQGQQAQQPLPTLQSMAQGLREGATAQAQEISVDSRRSAVRAASMSLGLGTLLALSGAAVLVKCTQWYLGVETAHEFAEVMRSKLPGQHKAVTRAMDLEVKKSSFMGWFRETMGVSAFIEARESDRRVKQLQGLWERGVLTEREFKEERRRLEEEGLLHSTA
eukprot:CAMPEP_0181301748 /NCGR_PEP_ID=MMETSP1101-20121128/7596_1 /TAXON_ID=46948 /ORGANISM="Rhodomonas abbreviata, Strain Caron Lab Isolate" /LENGTH=265 /DNA_ID=CAMNT_0023407087 /DNA_START=32 /DNA_END=829 /DNA_ORIENTATION=+